MRSYVTALYAGWEDAQEDDAEPGDQPASSVSIFSAGKNEQS